MTKPNAKTTSIAIGTGLLGTAVGVILLMPSCMCFDAAPNVNPSMKLLGYSGMATIPITIAATTLTILTGDLEYQSLYVLPVCGIVIGAIWDRKFNPPIVESPPIQFASPPVIAST
jgi:hypothetical protein